MTVSDRRNDILEAALALYNKNGLENVSTRDIAREIGISSGNLTYHFPTRHAIVLALMQRLLQEIDAALAIPVKRPYKSVLVLTYYQCKIIIDQQLNYEFLFNKQYGETITSLPEMQALLQQVLVYRFEQWKELNALIVKEKSALPALLRDSHAHSHALNIVGLYWHQEVSIYHPHLNREQKMDYALSLIFQLYKPYLTKKGLSELAPLVKSLGRYKAPA